MAKIAVHPKRARRTSGSLEDGDSDGEPVDPHNDPVAAGPIPRAAHSNKNIGMKPASSSGHYQRHLNALLIQVHNIMSHRSTLAPTTRECTVEHLEFKQTEGTA
eukprot:10678916-Alexandrium_andersonii.AAC.1